MWRNVTNTTMWYFRCKHEQLDSVGMFFASCGNGALWHYLACAFYLAKTLLSLFNLECEGAKQVRNERVKGDFGVRGGNCRSQEGQTHRLRCSHVVKQWKSLANTALFTHGCSTCRAGWRGLLRFTVFHNSLLEDTLPSRPE